MKTKNFISIILFIQFVLCIAVMFDIPIARQIVGFIYLTFIPGFILVKLLKVDTGSKVEGIIFVVGFSIAFLLVSGFLVNNFCLLLNVTRPFSLVVLLATFNGLIAILSILIIVCLRNVNFKACKDISIDFSPLMLLLIGLPILSVAGAMQVNIYENNALLLFLIIAIALIFTIAIMPEKLFSPRLYPFIILMIAVAILFHTAFVSNYVFSFGSDIPIEYFVFKNTVDKMYWDSTLSNTWNLQFGRIYNMLSVTILPAIYSTVLKISPTWTFKIIYPLLFSLVPLGLYLIWRRYVGNKYALAAAFFFSAYEIFYTEMLGLNRQIIGEIFFVLLLFLILNDKNKQPFNVISFVIFSFGLITSHYGLSLIFLFFFASSAFVLFALRRTSKNATMSLVILFFVLMFGWYIFTCRSVTFDSILAFGDRVRSELNEFFNPEARGEVVLRGLGLERPPTILNAISRAFAYATEALIVLGFVGLLTRRVKNNFKVEYFLFTFQAMFFLGVLIAVPGLAETMNMTRFYHVLLFFLAPLCVLGADFIVGLLMKRRRELATLVLMVCVLVPYFLFQTHFVFEVTGGYSQSVPLSGYRMDKLQLYALGYMDTYSVYGAQWISKNVDFTNLRLYSDVYSRYYGLTIYGNVCPDYVDELSNTTKVMRNGVVYLSEINVVDNVVPFGRFRWNSSELAFIFEDLSLVYANGGSVIYKKVP